MLNVARKILIARAAAAVFSVATNLIALHYLSEEEYARGAVAIAGAAVALPVLYQPFSKYVLVTGKWVRIGGLFWRLQFLTSAATLLVAIFISLLFDLSIGLVLSASFFSISQGWKEFCGEMARSMGNIQRMGWLYINDALVTAALTLLFLIEQPKAELFILSSAISSFFWSLYFTPFGRIRSPRTAIFGSLCAVYRYSYGVSAATFLNSSTLAVGRAAIKQFSPAELVGAIQFLLDILQKVVALLASSLLSAAIPEVRKGSVSALILPMVGVFLGALVGMIALSLFIAALPSGFLLGVDDFPWQLAVICGVYAWANRFKGSIFDMPLISDEKQSFFVIAGALTSFSLIVLLSRSGLSLIEFMIWSIFSLMLGGLVSAIIARRIGIIEYREIAYMLILPCVLFVSFSIGVGFA